MKKLLILPLYLLLSACVTYYYPNTALVDGIYYAEDDPSYVVNSGAAYYPWGSLDYFYLAYYPHRYYGYYSLWYVSHHYYPYNSALRPYNTSCSAYNGCQPRDRRSRRNSRADHFAGNDRSTGSSGSRGNGSRSVTSISHKPNTRMSSRQREN